MRPKPFTPSLIGASALVDILTPSCLLEDGKRAPAPAAANADLGLDARRSAASALTSTVSPFAVICLATSITCCRKFGVCTLRAWLTQATPARISNTECIVKTYVKDFATV
mmetsp:Transcript_75205/g.138534  ORF Transcript_75205/g.138534 Transcript_75205/m.138534 type:complete len:111 (+) Transcript_75205:81-413(+)